MSNAAVAQYRRARISAEIETESYILLLIFVAFFAMRHSSSIRHAIHKFFGVIHENKVSGKLSVGFLFGSRFFARFVWLWLKCNIRSLGFNSRSL